MKIMQHDLKITNNFVLLIKKQTYHIVFENTLVLFYSKLINKKKYSLILILLQTVLNLHRIILLIELIY